jgi:hypothetical protein
VVYAKPPFGGPRHVLKYLARYTHRVAIANQRLVAVTASQVQFRWTDYAHGHRPRTMTLEHGEFLRRFLLHALPRGFQRIRQYGFLANRRRAAALTQCRARLGAPPPDDDVPSEPPDRPAPPATCPTVAARTSSGSPSPPTHPPPAPGRPKPMPPRVAETTPTPTTSVEQPGVRARAAAGVRRRQHALVTPPKSPVPTRHRPVDRARGGARRGPPQPRSPMQHPHRG